MSFTTKIAGILAVLLVIASISRAQLSPGDLVEAHSHLEGMSNCTKCHTLGEKVSNDKCLDCHTELKIRVKQGKGYHASSEIKGKECVSCHSDHHGRNFQIIRFDTDDFNHNLTGYNLEGAHQKQECKACHKKEFISNPDIRKKDYTYLGLSTDCLSCHQDEHQGTLSNQCSNCHDFNLFKPASKFNHQNSNYPLQGKHLEVSCAECHKQTEKNGESFQQFTGLSYNNCNSCHQDVHNNNFGQDCRKCHNVESFFIIKGLSDFDHSKTDFLLEGKHLFVDCSDCHTSRYTDPVKHNRCDDCHDDYHRDQFQTMDSNPDCISCHDANGFTLSSFTVERHKQGSFELRGAHLATPCFACHQKENRWEFREIGMACNDCHTDIHESYIDTKYYPEANCMSCHSEESWKQIMFDHDLTNFSLEGEHKKQDCRSCHFHQSIDGSFEQKFKGLETSCNNCHQDVHAGQFEREGQTDCNRCHGPENWFPGKFDHNNARFVLDGKHKDVACEKCHIEVTEENSKFTKYKFETFTCESCHQ